MIIKLVQNQILLWFSFVVVYLIINTTTTTSQLNQNPRYFYYECNDTRNYYTTNSAYEKNLNTTFSTLPTTNNGFGFFNLSIGQGNNTVNSISLCRGDINPDICQSCLINTITRIRQLCSYKINATAYEEYCLFAYSSAKLLGNPDTWNYTSLSEPRNTRNVELFNAALRPLMDSLRAQASNGGPLKKFASGNTTGPDFRTIYALVQCTPDISKQNCNQCLEDLTGEIPRTLYERVGGKLTRRACNFRYGIKRFFNESDIALAIPLPPPSTQPPLVISPRPPPPSTQPPLVISPRPPPGKKINTTHAVTIVIGVIMVILVASLCILIRSKKRDMNQSETMDIGTPESLQYDFVKVQAATNFFSKDNKLGRGGFGAVYKGVFEDGHEIAVKRLAMDSAQGDVEFKNEVLLVARLQHRNLVRLLGFSIRGNERLLIYEFLPNASLDYFVFDPSRREFLDWEKRYKIIKGVAKGLLYLHEDSRLKIIHRDLKASNVLLDGEMNAKIADFGLARWLKLDESQADTSRVVGTHAYMAPEYILHGHFSVKTDVFSFGVLLLEIVAGQRNHSFQNGETIQNLLSFAWKRWENGTPSDMIDPTLKTGSAGSLSNIIRSIHIGLLCVQENVVDRPTIGSVVLMLNGLPILLPQPLQPAFLVHSTSTDPEMPLSQECSSSSGISGLERPELSKINLQPSPFSVNDVTISDIVPR